MESAKIDTIYTGLPDYKSALALVETRDIVAKIVEDFCGVVVLDINGAKSQVRIAKPSLTSDMAIYLGNMVFTIINRVTGRTDFSDEQISQICLKTQEKLADLTPEVIISVVSEKAWKRILEIAEPDKTQEYVTKDTKEKYYENFWKTKYDIDWSYNRHVSSSMLQIVKEKYGLIEEDFNQKAHVLNIVNALMVFIRGGLNRSKEHLTLDHEKVIHKESMTQAGDVGKGSGQGGIQGVRNKVDEIFSGGRK